MEGEERASESRWDLVGLKKKRGGGGMETGNQLLGRCFSLATCAATPNQEVCVRGRKSNGHQITKIGVKAGDTFPLSPHDNSQCTNE